MPASVFRCAALAAALLTATGAGADTAYVTKQSSDDVSVVDLTSMRVVATIPIGGKPAGVAVPPDGRHAYAVSYTHLTLPTNREV